MSDKKNISKLIFQFEEDGKKRTKTLKLEDKQELLICKNGFLYKVHITNVGLIYEKTNIPC